MAGEVEKKRLSIYKKTIKGQAEVEEGSNYLPVSTLSSRQDPKEKPAFLLTNLFHIANMNPDEIGRAHV